LGQNSIHEISSKDEMIFFSPTLSSIKPKKANIKRRKEGQKGSKLEGIKSVRGGNQEEA